MENGVQPYAENKLEEQSRGIQERLDTFDQRITRQLESGKIADISEIKVKVAEL